MHNRVIFLVSAIGLLLALVSAYIFSQQPKAQPPLFSPAANPFSRGIYADGMIESDQAQGENINIYPEVAGPITAIPVTEGQAVHRGEVLLSLDDSVQRALAEQQQAQAEAAHAMLQELKAQPRRETLAVVAAQVENARASLKSTDDQLAKQQRSFEMDARSVSQDAYDNAKNARNMAVTNMQVVQRQYALVKAGAWTYDLQNAEKTYVALQKAHLSSSALLAKYTIRAPTDGVVLAVRSSVGSYVSPQGAYDSYSEGFGPLIIMGQPQSHLQVRAYIDEILVHELPDPSKIKAEMSVRGTNTRVALSFVRIQPFISPKIELSDARQERVDLRVLPIIFRFDKPKSLNVYPGQLVDVYVGSK